MTSVLEALDGEEGVVEYCYIRNMETEARFLSLPVLLGVSSLLSYLARSVSYIEYGSIIIVQYITVRFVSIYAVADDV